MICFSYVAKNYTFLLYAVSHDLSRIILQSPPKDLGSDDKKIPVPSLDAGNFPILYNI